MNFGLIGVHPDGVAMAQALAKSGHALVAIAGPKTTVETLRQSGMRFEAVGEVEALLARADVEMVIVADDLGHRPAVLRRALQAEKHVLCVHPADVRLDAVYEAVLIQKDTRRLLLPLLFERLGPGFTRLQQLCRQGVFGKLQVIECERRPPESIGEPSWDRSPLVRVWDMLRGLGGEIQEVSALASTPGEVGEELPALQPGDAVTLTGRFEQGGLFRVLLLPQTAGQAARLVLRGEEGQAELTFAEEAGAGSRLVTRVKDEEHAETFPGWQPWEALTAVVADRLAGRPSRVSWQDGIRCLELFDAARRSAQRGRVASMHYGDITEESTFKGAMTAAGCGMLWVVLLLVFAGVWAPWLWYAIVPLLGAFLALQLLRWMVPREGPSSKPRSSS